jgi:D-aspartate ligase
MKKNHDGMKIGDVSTPVLVLKIFEHCGLGIARSLGRMGIPVYGVHHDLQCPAALSRYWRGLFLWDIDNFRRDEAVQFLLETARNFGPRPILIPTGDSAALFVADNADALRKSFAFPNQSAELVHTLSNKKSMYSLCKRLGVPTAETVFPQSRADVLRFLKNANYPIMLKGIDSSGLEQRTGIRMTIVQNEKELLEKYDRLEDAANPNLMLQEYIPGGDDTIWMFNGYFNEQSDCLIGLTGRKLRQYPVHTGMTSLGICQDNKTVEETTTQFMKAIGYRGILDIGFRYDVRDGNYKLLDVNPRIGATFRLFVAENGLDVLRALYLDLTGQSVPPGVQRQGRKWIVEVADPVSFKCYRAEGKLTILEWLRSLRGIQETAWFARDDFAPFKAVLMCFLRKLFRWVSKKVWPAWSKVPSERVANLFPGRSDTPNLNYRP